MQYPHQCCLWWGPELTLIYNAPYAEVIHKHPDIFGTSGPKAWSGEHELRIMAYTLQKYGTRWALCQSWCSVEHQSTRRMVSDTLVVGRETNSA